MDQTFMKEKDIAACAFNDFAYDNIYGGKFTVQYHRQFFCRKSE